jgi:hypothetical protein
MNSTLQTGPEFRERLLQLTSTDKQVRREVSDQHRLILHQAICTEYGG